MGAAPTPDWLERANRFALTSALLSTTVLEANNALQVISGSAEILIGTSPPNLVARRSDAIGVQARRTSALLAELVAFARDDSTQVVPVQLAPLAQRALALRQYALASLKIQSSLEAARGLPTIAANSRAMLQVILNLIVNAEQALEKSGGHLWIVVQAEGEKVVLTVEDDGPGVSPEAAATLFTPCTQGTGGRLGIGLAVARSIAQRYGGTLEFVPRPGGGAGFLLAFDR